ncbi:PIG-L family deacetylase [Gordonia prachuapensis]
MMIDTTSRVTELGTILGIWAHPDDEAYLAGGMMAIARRAGSRVVCVTATRGELGTADNLRWPKLRLARTRTDELARCLAVLGVTEHHWLAYRDGGCAAADEGAAVAQLCEIIDDVRPDTILTFGPDGFTGHPDHRTVSSWATAAFARTAAPGTRLMYAAVSENRNARWGELNERLGVYLPGFPVVHPSESLAVDLPLDDDVVDLKVRALAAQETQTSALIEELGMRSTRRGSPRRHMSITGCTGPARSPICRSRVSQMPIDGFAGST